ncbi:hypothetical protein AB2384_20280 [Klebsiella pneumoniae]
MEQTDKRKQDKLKFDRVINLARRLPQPAIQGSFAGGGGILR